LTCVVTIDSKHEEVKLSSCGARAISMPGGWDA
jgi:hypothetical protein